MFWVLHSELPLDISSKSVPIKCLFDIWKRVDVRIQIRVLNLTETRYPLIYHGEKCFFLE